MTAAEARARELDEEVAQSGAYRYDRSHRPFFKARASVSAVQKGGSSARDAPVHILQRSSASALACCNVPHWSGHVWRTCWDFRSQFWASSGHSSRLPLKPRFRAIQRYKNYPLRAKIEVQRFSRPFCGSVDAKCASAHMMRSNTKIQINSANSDLILQAHYGYLLIKTPAAQLLALRAARL